MIIKLDHYRRSRTRDLIDSYYAQPESGDTPPEREVAKVLYAVWRPAPCSVSADESIATPELG
jgi:hypothetical protein